MALLFVSFAFQHRTCLFFCNYHKENRNNRHVRKHALSATTTGRVYPGRNNDCGRHNYPAGSARDPRVPSVTKTSASLASNGRSAAHRSRRRSICNRNPEAAGSVVSVVDWTSYLKKETLLCTTGKDLLGHDFGSQTVDQIPSVPPATYAALSDVADDGFWAPFGP